MLKPDLLARGKIPKTYFKMANTAGHGTGRIQHYIDSPIPTEPE
jgi:hypothetical protein